MAKVNHERISMSTKSQITGEIREQILAVRDTGRTNMFDVPSVMSIANEMKLFDLVSFLTESNNKRVYCKFILYGDRHE